MGHHNLSHNDRFRLSPRLMSEYARFATDDDIALHLASSDWRQRREAIKALFEKPDERLIPFIMEQLGSEVPCLRHDAGVALVNLAVRLRPAVLARHSAALSEMLQHEDPAVHQSCAHVLVLTDHAHSAVLLRTLGSSRRDAQAHRALKLAFQSDLVQPNKALPLRRLIAEVAIALLSCALFLSATVWLSTRPASPPHAYHPPCPHYCRSYRPQLSTHLLGTPSHSSSTSLAWRPSQSGRLLEEAKLGEAALPDDDGAANATDNGGGGWSPDDGGDDWSAGGARGAAPLGAFGLGWRVWPSVAAVAVVCFMAWRLVGRYRKAKEVGTSSTRTTTAVAAPVVQVESAGYSSTTVTTTTSVIHERRLSPAVSVGIEPLRFECGALELPPSQVVRSLLEPGVAMVHHQIFGSHMPHHAFPRETQGLLAIERVAHALTDRLTRAYRFNRPILSCAPQPSPLFAVPAVHWAAAPAEVARRRYTDILFMCTGAVPIGTQSLAKEGQVSPIELNTSGDYQLQPPQGRADDLILLGHPMHWKFGNAFSSFQTLQLEGPEPVAPPPCAAAKVLLLLGPGYAHHVGEEWRVGERHNPLSQLVRELDGALPQGSQLTILAPPHTVARIVAGLCPTGGLSRVVSAEARAATADSLARGCEHSNRLIEFAAATHVLLLEAGEAEAVALKSVAPATRIAACRGGRFYLSETASTVPEEELGGGRGSLSPRTHPHPDPLPDPNPTTPNPDPELGAREEGHPRTLVDYTLPHPRVFGPEAEEKVHPRAHSNPDLNRGPT